MSNPDVYMVCATCGSAKVLCDAYAEWNYYDQEWMIASTFDKGAYCNKCDGECRIEEATSKPPDYNE